MSVVRDLRLGLLCALIVAATAAFGQTPKPAQKPGVEPEQQSKKADAEKEKKEEGQEGRVGYRQIGPFRGGRSLTATGIAGDPTTYYFGGTGGGVFKSTDGALTWKPVFDHEGSGSIGALAVAPSDPNIVYVGTGEGCIRGNAAQGDGVYKSLDAGKTWKNVGLRDSRAIGRIVVHPRNPDVAWVAALGHPFGPNAERGVFRTTDGGKTWDKVLFKDNDTGAIDLAIDPHNPNILFAALWQVRRYPWTLASGGPGSGIYRSHDGGSTWKRLEGGGLPAGPYGRIGVAVAANSERVYALIEAKDAGLYRSDNGGGTWELVNPNHRYTQRAWYYMHIFADPVDENGVYIMNVDFHHSTDAGRTFNKIRLPHGDNHGLWIDPRNPKRMIATNDGGATLTLDGGKSWSRQDNQPTAQFYHVIADNRDPYWLYGAQQDNSTVAIASRSDAGSIREPDWFPVAGGESGYIAPWPTDPLITYGTEYQGQVSRFDKHTGQTKEVSVFPRLTDAVGAAGLDHRFQWTSPLFISPHDPDALYHAGERLFLTRDGGMHWDAVSPDLTRNDKSKQIPSGGPITIDDTGTEYYDTIFAAAESPLQKGLIWAGSDDGLVHVTRDGGKSWQKVTPRDLPEWSRISQIDPSPHSPGTAYVAVDRHQNDDLNPYIFKTSDFGATWTRADNGIPVGSFVRAVREDPARKGLLYAGTETGVFVSYDDGTHWRPLQLNLPTVPVHDLVVKGNDLLLATHGRAFWILDDLSSIRQFNPATEKDAVTLYRPSPALRLQIGRGRRRDPLAGDNPPVGAVIDFNLAAAPKNAVLEIRDAKGGLVRRVSNQQTEDLDEQPDPEDEKPKKQLEVKAGMNRYVWDLRYDSVPRLPNYFLYEYQSGTSGPMVLPGTYEVRLTVDGQTASAPLEVRLDPRVKISPGDLQKQFDTLLQIHRELRRVYDAASGLLDLRAQIEALTRRLNGRAPGVAKAGEDLDHKLLAVQDALLNTKITANEDSLRYPPQLDAKLAYLASSIGSGNDFPPTAAQLQEFDLLRKAADEQIARWNGLLQSDVAAFTRVVQQNNAGGLILPSADAAGQKGPE